MLPMTVQAQTLEACQQAAERNYPLIQQYGLIEKTTELAVSNIRKGWLPQVSASAQATLQSDVTAFPDQIQQVYQTMGVNMKGLRKDQYRIGIDVQQTVYDGGAIKSQQEIARQQGEVQAAQNEVNIYNVRKRVNEMFFGLLLTDEQIILNKDLQELLEANENKLASMVKGGTAAESDYQNMKAERLKVCQQAVSLQAQRQALARMLSALCGIEVKNPVKPTETKTGTGTGSELCQWSLHPSRSPRFRGAETPESFARRTVNCELRTANCEKRPELKVIDSQIRLADAQEKALDAALIPKLGVFAQGFYGYPGYNMFEDMMNRKFSWNGMIGARLTWNIGALYTRKNDKAKLNLQRSMFNVQRETFLFNNDLEQIEQNENISRYRKLMADDDEIVSLRSSIRKAAESKLSHGIIDVNDLLEDINNENAARVQHRVHEIEMLKEIYDMKYTVND